MQFTLINTISVVDEVIKKVTDAIVSRQLKPGQKIPSENELCEELGVGRNSLREAMKILSALGVLEIRRGDGTYVSKKISPSIFDSLVYSIIMEQSTQEEILELRKTLEIDILELAVQKVTAEDINALEKQLELFRLAIEQRDYKVAAERDVEFHHVLLDIARNPFLKKIMIGIYRLFYPSVEKNLRGSREPLAAYENHAAIVELIKKRDTKEIPAIIEKSLESWKNYLKTE